MGDISHQVSPSQRSFRVMSCHIRRIQGQGAAVMARGVGCCYYLLCWGVKYIINDKSIS